LRAKIPQILPCEDCAVGIKLSEPVFDGGRVRLSIPGFLTLFFGLINPYLQHWVESIEEKKRVFAYENFYLTLKDFEILDLEGISQNLPLNEKNSIL
jgi:hypothetical protein